MRRAGDAEPTRLGEGFAGPLSPDGKWVLAETWVLAELPGSKLSLLPTGAGESRPLDVSSLERIDDYGFFPDGRRIAISGNEKGRPLRTFVLEISGGKPRPLTPEKLGGAAVSPDGKWILVSETDTDKPLLFPTEGGEPRPVPGLTEDDAHGLQWGPDSVTLFFHQHGESHGENATTHVFRLNIATGSREPWLTIKPPDPAGIGRTPGPEPRLSADGKSYVYFYARILNDLYLAEGLK
jgi:eukaryotic-like serine/threonine-protein kinase